MYHFATFSTILIFLHSHSHAQYFFHNSFNNKRLRMQFFCKKDFFQIGTEIAAFILVRYVFFDTLTLFLHPLNRNERSDFPGCSVLRETAQNCERVRFFADGSGVSRSFEKRSPQNVGRHNIKRQTNGAVPAAGSVGYISSVNRKKGDN